MVRKKSSGRRAKSGDRRFVLNRRSKTISIHSPSGAGDREAIDGGALNVDDFLEALIEVEKMLTPTLIEDQVPVSDAIPFLADAMYIYLTGEMEIQNPQLRVSLIEFILVTWERGQFVPSESFPYTLSELQQEVAISSLDDVRASLEEALAHPEAISPEINRPSSYELLKEDMREIDQERDRFLRLGKQALRRKRFDLAEKHFRNAVELDTLDESEACYYLALTRLWQRDFGEAHYLFDVDHQDREGEAPLSWVLTEWCAICAASSPSAYLTSILDEMDEGEDPLQYKEELFSFDYGAYPDEAFHHLVAALFAYIRGSFEESLELLEECKAPERDLPTWVVPFWKSMANLALGLHADALKWLRHALTAEIPPLLLLPLRWHEHDPSDVFEQDMHPLFDNFGLWSQVIELNEREQKNRKERQERIQWWMEQGTIAYTEHRFTQAEEFFYLAFQERLFAKEDLGDLAIARFWYALVCLQGGEFGGLERVLLEDGKKDTVCQNIGVLPTLLGEWYRMCHYETQSAYLASLPHGLNLQGHFRELLAGVLEGPGGRLLRAVATCVDGHPGQSLKALLSIQTDNKIDPPWLATFWLGMAEIFTDHATQAQETFRLAVTQGMPEVLLLPTWWCRENALDTFAETLRPLLDTHHLPSPQEFWG